MKSIIGVDELSKSPMVPLNNQDMKTVKSKFLDVTGLKDSVGRRVTLMTKECRFFRVAIGSSLSFQSALTRRFFDIVDLVMSASTSDLLRSRMVPLIDTYNSDPENDQSSCGDKLWEWEIVIRMLSDHFASLNDKYQQNIVFTSNSENNIELEESAWQNLLTSEYHNSFLEHNESLVRCVATNNSADTLNLNNVHKRTQNVDKNNVKNGGTVKASIFDQDPVMISKNIGDDALLLKNDIPILFLGLHMLYEDSKISLLSYPLLRRLSTLLFALAQRWVSAVGVPKENEKHRVDQGRKLFQKYIEYYRRENASIDSLPGGFKFAPANVDEVYDAAVKVAQNAAAKPTAEAKGDSMNSYVVNHSPPNVMRWLYQCILKHNSNGSINKASLASTKPPFIPFKMSTSPHDSQYVPKVSSDETWRLNNSMPKEFSESLVTADPCSLTRKLCRYYEDLSVIPPDTNVERKLIRERIVVNMVKDGFTRQLINTLPFGVSLPLLQVLRDCRELPPLRWPVEAYELVGRKDLSILQPRCRSSRSANREENTLCVNDKKLSSLLSACNSKPSAETSANYICWKPPLRLSASTCMRGDIDGLELLQDQAKLRFCRDKRLREVCRLLRSSKLMRLRFQRTAETSDAELLAEHQKALHHICVRALALPVGRGMLTLSTTRPVSTETLPIPPLVLSARVVEENNAVRELVTTSLPTDFTDWPEFHNGAAAGLRLCSVDTERGRRGGDPVASVTRTWIVYNKPPTPTCKHAGFLLGLGLQGHLSVLRLTDIYSYLVDKHEATTIGLLLGMSACKRGTADKSVYKMLCLHLPAILPSSFAEISTSSGIQTSALLGVGLLYQSTAHRLMAEFLLREIARGATERDAGDNASRGSRGSSGGEGYSLAAGLGLGLLALGRGRQDRGGAKGLADLHIEDRLQRYMTGGRDRATITASGATLALGMMFLKSNNHSVAQRLAVPDTLFLMDYVRPDLLLLRVLCRGLVLWDEVKGTNEWIQAQVPRALLQAYVRIGKMDPTNIDGDNDDEEDETVLNNGNVDLNSIRQSYANIVAGACAAIGYRFAGTADAEAYETLMHHLQLLSKFQRRGHHQRPDAATLQMCIGTTALALAMVMAGRGDLPTLRILRELRWKTGPKISYGRHMVLHSAIGLLFMGGGAMTLSRSDDAIGAMLCAFFPRYPLTTSDQQYHLQAVRHLYTLATERRLIQAIDADTHVEIIAPMTVTLKATKNYRRTNLNLMIPCMLPDIDTIERIVIGGPIPSHVSNRLAENISIHDSRQCVASIASSRYWPLHLDIAENSAHRALLESVFIKPKTDKKKRFGNVSRSNGAAVLLKRKAAHLSYELDPRGLRSLMVRPYSDGERRRRALSEFIAAFTHDPEIVMFAQQCCRLDGIMSNTSSHNINTNYTSDFSDYPSEFDEFCCAILYECLTQDKPEMLRTYLDIQQSLKQLDQTLDPVVSSQQLWNLKLVLAQCDRYNNDCVSKSLIDRSYAHRVAETMDKYFGSFGGFGNLRKDSDHNENGLSKYLISSKFPCSDFSKNNFTKKNDSFHLGRCLIYFNVPLLGESCQNRDNKVLKSTETLKKSINENSFDKENILTIFSKLQMNGIAEVPSLAKKMNPEILPVLLGMTNYATRMPTE